jgi:streptogramin lyase
VTAVDGTERGLPLAAAEAAERRATIEPGAGDVAVRALSTSVGTISRIDPATNDVRYQVQVGTDPSGLAVGSGAVWVGDEDGIIRRADEDTRQVTEIPFGAEIHAIAFDEDTDTLWVDVV